MKAALQEGQEYMFIVCKSVSLQSLSIICLLKVLVNINQPTGV